jgi:hypothetical protein
MPDPVPLIACAASSTESALEAIVGVVASVAAFSCSRDTASNSLPHNRVRLRSLATQLSHSPYTAITTPASQTLTLQKAYAAAPRERGAIVRSKFKLKDANYCEESNDPRICTGPRNRRQRAVSHSRRPLGHQEERHQLDRQQTAGRCAGSGSGSAPESGRAVNPQPEGRKPA